MNDILSKTDPELFDILNDEIDRQRCSLGMIASENNVSDSVLSVLGSILTNKYSEGYPGRRYYGGNQFIDKIESLAINRAKKVFNVPYANVQPYSGSPANFSVCMAVCKPNDTIMGLELSDGGHLTHGFKASFSGKLFNSIQYHVNEKGFIDLEGTEKLILEHKPKLIWIGFTAYTREFPFEKFGEMADKVGAYLVADISHISGLIASGIHKSPAPFAHIITTTTHKTFRGPRGGIVMITQKGLDKDPELPNKIDKSIFPGMQGGPHNNSIGAIAAALKEMMQPEFKEYCEQIVKNSKALAESLMKNGIKLVTNGTDNHMVLVDLTPFGRGKGIFAQEALEEASITTNKNSIPSEPSSNFYPSGLRIGTPLITTRGMKEGEIKKIGKWISEVIHEIKDYELPEDKQLIDRYIDNFRKEIKKNRKILRIKEEIIELCKDFPLFSKSSS